jgi:DNA uptake protein ComE-like DNA-binding protein
VSGSSVSAVTAQGEGRRDTRRQLPTLGPVDVDLADSAALERLPRIGPALAARIVSDRGARGPFGSLAGLERVRGIGPKLVQLLGPLVTFSGIPRPSTVQR